MNGLDLTYGGAFDWLFVCLLFFVSFLVDVILSFVFVVPIQKGGREEASIMLLFYMIKGDR